MRDGVATVPLWTRAVADERFRADLIDDPLRAVAAAGNIDVSAEQMRLLEEMDVETRTDLVTEVVRQVHWAGGAARFGGVGPDGRIGGLPGT
jgi:phage baseplate assembly protein gpV